MPKYLVETRFTGRRHYEIEAANEKEAEAKSCDMPPTFEEDEDEEDEDEEEEERQPAETEGVGELHRVLPDPYRVQVQEDVVHHGVRARPLVVGVRVPEERPPDHASADALVDPLQEAQRAPPATPGIPASRASRYDSL